MDGRLLLPAGAAWLASIAVLTGQHWWWFAAALVLVAQRPPRSLLLATLAAVACSAAAAALHLHSLQADPLASWGEARASATVVAGVGGEAGSSTDQWGTAVLEVRATTREVRARGARILVQAPIILRLPAGAAPQPGSVIEAVGSLGPGDVRWGVAATLRVGDAERVRTLEAPGPIDAAANAMRASLHAAVLPLPQDAGSLVAGLAVGDESLQTPELSSAMQRSGLSHLTAVSGGNLAILIAVVLGACALLHLRLPIRIMVALAAISFFVVLVRPQPSVLRASVMGSVVLVGMLAGGRRAGPSVLCIAVIVLLVVQPGLAISWAFALSVFATAGLILLAPRLLVRLDARFPHWPGALREGLAVTGAAQLATLPVLVGMGGTVGLASLPANLLAMPAVPPVTVLGLLAAVPLPVLPGVCAWLAAPFAAWIAWVAGWASGLPLAAIPWPSGAWGVVLLAAAGAAVLLSRRLVPPTRSLKLVALLAAGCLVLLYACWPPRAWPPPGWVLAVCDVGQGDALVVRDGPSVVVVDVGPDDDLIDGCLANLGIASVSALVLTHFHADHVGGLAGALRGRSVHSALLGPLDDPPAMADDVRARLAKAGIPWIVAHAGETYRAGELTWRVLWPRRIIHAGSMPNNASIVLEVRAGGLRILLAGDVEPEAQAAIIAGESGGYDIVKVPHHGSRYQDPRLPAWAGARVALISVGAGNDYGHPDPETIAVWESAGAEVLRTDTNGSIAVLGPNLQVATTKESPPHGMLAAHGGPHHPGDRRGALADRPRRRRGRRCGAGGVSRSPARLRGCRGP